MNKNISKIENNLLLHPLVFFIMGCIYFVLAAFLQVYYSNGDHLGNILPYSPPPHWLLFVIFFGPFVFLVYSLVLKRIKQKGLKKMIKAMLDFFSIILIVFFLFGLLNFVLFLLGFFPREFVGMNLP
jgi:hypothetical protein